MVCLKLRRGSFNASAELLGPVAGEEEHLPDAFLRTPGFTKGVAFVNGFNLGWCCRWAPRARICMSAPQSFTMFTSLHFDHCHENTCRATN